MSDLHKNLRLEDLEAVEYTKPLPELVPKRKGKE